MNEVIRTILKRRSIRSYRDEPLGNKDLETLLLCALYAPTGGNSQGSRFLVVRDPKLLTELNTIIREELLSFTGEISGMQGQGIRRAQAPAYHFLYHAPTLIAAVAPRADKNSMANCAAGLATIMLAAVSLGIGTCWSNQLRWLTDSRRIRPFFGSLGLREDEDFYGAVGAGYPAAVLGRAAERRPGRIVIDGVPSDGKER
ncbi:MAG: nitroreductase family protein [Lachnospiraceae bacterium]|nr:nitroreductase family protein [Lachnospiraceae bacterium]